MRPSTHTPQLALAFVFGSCLALFAAAAIAQAPRTLSYQGRLVQNTADQGAVDGMVDIVFSLWTGPASDATATQLWSESWSGVALSNGIFSVLLGSNGSPLDPADFQSDWSLFLQLQVDGETLLPRQQLGSAPFALVDEPANEFQDLELSGDQLGLSDSSVSVDLSPYLDDADEQDLSLSDNTLSLTNDSTSVDLSGYLDNTDEQDLSLAGNILSLTGDPSAVDLSGFADNTDEQNLSLAGNTLSLTNDSTPVDLSGYLDNTDAQALGLVANTLSISGSLSSVDLSGYLDNTDAQTFSLSGDTLTLSGSGSSVDLSSYMTRDEVIDLHEFLEDRTVFVTSESFNGNLGGVEGADQKCQNAASAAGLSGNFLAWISGGGESPSTRFIQDARAFYLVDGTKIADDWVDLTDEILLAPIDVTELGTTVGDGAAWTGTDAYGMPAIYNCSDWSTTSGNGTFGLISAINAQWSEAGFPTCNNSIRLYCVQEDLAPYLNDTDEQDLSLVGNTLSLTNDPTTVDLSAYLDDTDAQTLGLDGDDLTISGSGSTVDLSAATAITDLRAEVAGLGGAVLGRAVFVSSQTYTGNLGGLEGADVACQSLADSAGVPGTFLAWLSDSTGSPSSRFELDGGPFVTIDGSLIARDWNDLLTIKGDPANGDYLRHAIDRTETGSLVSADVWTATNATGYSIGVNCDGWSSDASGGIAGRSDRLGAEWTAGEAKACSESLRLYCFSQTSDLPVSPMTYLDDRDDQQLSVSGNELRLTSDDGTDAVDLSPYLDDTTIDNQQLSLSGDELRLTSDDGTDTVDLSALRDNTDTQTVSLAGNELTISGSGSTVDLASIPAFAELQAQIDQLRNQVELAARIDWLEYRTIFVTAERYEDGGDLGGLDGADAKCQAAADAAGFFGIYRAWLSDSTTSAAERHSGARDRPIRRVDGTIVAQDWADLIDGTLAAPIELTETGGPFTKSPWTGTDSDGSSLALNCLDWTTGSLPEFGVPGNPTFTSAGWSRHSSIACSARLSLYCLSD